ncbi:DUF3822 family protein [Gramella sp. AN32]|uniref:DUF3822 family protein n=1 Tax=Christiangramia antarctica TaxID=2058158 RepID=A0ABW5X6P5_9FLAO|nr:DUF3822 family protein [Gramella sp. AN32]MCM4156032.1 DUF3822 domain-containing protein [Gramella sp. AN32]
MDLISMVGRKTTSNKNLYKNKLSIQVSLNGLSFCILNEETKEIIYYKKIPFEKQLDPIKVLAQIELAYENDHNLNVKVDEVKVFFTNSLFTLVPSTLFEEQNASGYLKFNTKILKTDFIAFDRLDPEIVNVYIPYANITNYFFDKYGEYEYQHSLSILINSLIAHNQKDGRENVYLHTYGKNYDLVILDNDKLLFANTFEFETREDFLYYLLFTAEQLKMDSKNFNLILLGDIKKDSEEYRITWDYVKNVSFLGAFHPYTFISEEKPEEERAEYLLLKSFECA